MSRQPTKKLAVVWVHSLDQAVAALEAAVELKRPVTLASNAAGSGGVAWFLALIAQARDAVPAARCEALLDCADQTGWALEALRLGCPLVGYHGSRKTAAKLANIAEQLGARLITGSVEGLDLLGEADPGLACQRWLEGRGTP